MWRSQLLPLLIMPPLLVMATTCDMSCSSKGRGSGSSAMGGGTCVTCESSDQNVSVWSLVWMSRCLDPLRFGEARYSSLSFPGCRAPRALGAPRWVLGVVTEKALSLAPGTWEAFWLCKLNMNNINEECVSAKLSVYVLSGIYLKNKQEWEDCWSKENWSHWGWVLFQGHLSNELMHCEGHLLSRHFVVARFLLVITSKSSLITNIKGDWLVEVRQNFSF